ncbi:hypothetical protein, partial [Hyphomonas sp. ND6WE1B]|uniref:hypothetical protein n=1 Tax=Hyphomonas sp. ND6WE1B TaxID=1848191 RepID=UPI001F3A0275
GHGVPPSEIVPRRGECKNFPAIGPKYGISAKNRVETLPNWARHARRTALCTRQRTQSRDKDNTSEKAT